jgi:hypothetical protein
MDFNIFSKNKKTKEDFTFDDWVGKGIMNCSNCASKQDASRGSVCVSCNYENDSEKRRRNEVIEKQKLENDDRIRVEKERIAAGIEYVEIAKTKLGNEFNLKIIDLERQITKKKKELGDERIKFLKFSNEKFEDLSKYPEIIEKAKKKVRDESENELKLKKEKLQTEFETRIDSQMKQINDKKMELENKEKELLLLTNEKLVDVIKIPEVIEKAKKEIYEENKLKKVEEEEKKKVIKAEFMEIINFIRINFQVTGKVHDEDALESQLIQVLQTQFKNKNFVRQFSTGIQNRLDILIDGKFVIELKIPESPVVLRNLYGQLRDYWEEYDEICVFILRLDGFDSKVIELWTERYKNDFGIESIVKDGEKKKPNIEGMNSKLD